MSQKKIIFHENSLNERGTSIAVYDYAYYSRELLDLDPIICYDTKYQNSPAVIEKFKKEFDTISYENFSEVQLLVDRIQPDYFYALKYGTPDHILVNGSKNLIHSVFSKNINDVHGDVYAVVSEWQSLQTGNKVPFVPHMLNLPKIGDDIRDQLSIPKNHVVVGRYGAKDTFNVNFAPSVVLQVLEKRKDMWMLFANTSTVIEHPRCIYLNEIVDINEKVRFINTCDAMLHARDYGETFGLSVLEFASKNKQIISYDNEALQSSHPLGGRNHFLFLGQNCFKYQNQQQLGHILMYLTKSNPFNTEYLVDKFSPSNVMLQFKKVFL